MISLRGDDLVLVKVFANASPIACLAAAAAVAAWRLTKRHLAYPMARSLQEVSDNIGRQRAGLR